MSPDRGVDVTAVIVNYNTAELIDPCVQALRASAGSLNLQIVIIDNNSRDGSRELLRSNFSGCDLVFNEENVGFGRASNQALPMVRGRYVLLLNTDAFVDDRSLSVTAAYLDQHSECGLVGVRLVGRDGALQPSCRYFPTPWNEFLSETGLSRFFPGTQLVDDMAWNHESLRECDWVPGCFYLVRKAVVDQVGLFDPRYFLYFEEVDQCRAIKAAGWRVVFHPGATVVHIGGESARKESELTSKGHQISALQIESSLLYFRKHHGRLGVWTAAFLSSLADVVLTLKWLAALRPLRGVAGIWRRSTGTWRLLWLTWFGTRPTR